jgi:hypothetical protein
MKPFPLAVLTASFALASCVPPPTRVAITLPPKPAEQVSIIHTLPGRPYQVVAEFQGIGLTESRIRQMGGKLGADAVYVSNYNISFAAGESSVVSPGMRQGGLNSESLCTAISYR